MEKDRGSKTIAIAALMIAVVGLSVGFAAFSNSLTISSSANVSPDSSTFKVVFSSSGTSLEVNSVVPTLSGDVTADSATISNASDSPTITGLKAQFTEPGQSATYTFYATNQGEYDAYLNSITYANATTGTADSFRICTAGEGTDETLVAAACDDISVTVTVGSLVTTGSVTDIASHLLSVGSYETIVVTITYDTDGDRADGDFSVAFGDISLSYGSVD